MKTLKTNVLLFIVLLLVGMRIYAQDGGGYHFAQISDLHIDAISEKNISALERVVSEINSETDIAFVLVSGDIADRGDMESLRIAKKTLDRLSSPYYIIPGNHDTRLTPFAATEYAQVFGEPRFRLQFLGMVFLGVPTGPELRNTQGHIAPEDLTWIRRQLKNVGRKTPVFIITHHPLRTGDVDNWYELTDVIRRHNIQMVISGHYHRNVVNSYDAIPGIISRSLVDSEGRAGYTIFSPQNDSIFVSEKIVDSLPFQWAALSLSQKNYLDGDSRLYPRPLFDVNSQYRNVRRIYTRTFPNAILTAPIVADGCVVFADNKGVIHCLSMDNGKQIWEHESNLRVTSLTMSNQLLVCYSPLGEEISLALSDGKVIARSQSEFAPFTQHLPSQMNLQWGSRRLTTSADGLISCFAADDRLMWQHKIGNTVITGVAILDESSIVVTTVDGILIRLSVK